jgi:hypothetical protein
MYSHKQKYKLDLINWINLQKSNNFQFLSKEIYVQKASEWITKCTGLRFRNKKKWNVSTFEDQSANCRLNAPSRRCVTAASPSQRPVKWLAMSRNTHFCRLAITNFVACTIYAVQLLMLWTLTVTNNMTSTIRWATHTSTILHSSIHVRDQVLHP